MDEIENEESKKKGLKVKITLLLKITKRYNSCSRFSNYPKRKRNMCKRLFRVVSWCSCCHDWFLVFFFFFCLFSKIILTSWMLKYRRFFFVLLFFWLFWDENYIFLCVNYFFVLLHAVSSKMISFKEFQFFRNIYLNSIRP